MALWGKTDADASRPKHLSAADLANAIFIDETEAGLAVNKARGLNNAGWWLYTSHTDQDGNTRHKAQCLVALSASAANAGDRADDTKAADATYVTTISVQPANQNTSAGGATFAVTAAVSAGGGTLVYQWQKKLAAAGSKFANVAGQVNATLVLTGVVAGATGDKYRVKITTTNGAAEVVSNEATLTFVN